ncbi:hypothetical protein BZL30_7884 [Mycobacterium kansasii]|uniref:Uncharacterized protein n=1 Tax=Mycobacterium kansasii TaxID=1768 RepID=A0A1V3WKF1_MYCKA|nr:hypothetical protein BZL30_7884 [Mycobacterium kansasii]
MIEVAWRRGFDVYIGARHQISSAHSPVNGNQIPWCAHALAFAESVQVNSCVYAFVERRCGPA